MTPDPLSIKSNLNVDSSSHTIEREVETDADPSFDDALFDSNLLKGMGQNIDLSRFAKAGDIASGKYRIDIIVNGKSKLRQTVIVQLNADDDSKQFCFTLTDVTQWGVVLESLPNQAQVEKILEQSCIEVEQLIPDATFKMNLASLSGDLSIPQAYVGMIRPGYIDPSEWDEGINAGFVDYSANAFHNRQVDSDNKSSLSVNVRSGLNISGWRLRHDGRYDNKNDSPANYQTQKNYAQIDVTPATAQLSMGEYFTPGEILNSIAFTGVQIASDDSMLPESERGYAPVVRGVADTNARVTITQGGNMIYETTVAPGPFSIDELYPNSNSGDLDVTVTEADGRTKRFTVPFSAVIQMLRPGSSRFSITLGRYRDDDLADEPEFGQATYSYGVGNDLTVYVGANVSQGYSAVLVGSAINTPIGSVSLDVTSARAKSLDLTSKPDQDSFKGERYRLSFNRLIDYSQTNIAITASKFSNEEYVDFNDFANFTNNSDGELQRERSRYQLNIDQPFGNYGSFYMSGIVQNYWDSDDDTTTFQMGYSKGFDWGNVNLSVSRELEDDSDEESNEYLLTVSVPFEFGRKRAYINTSISSNGNDEHAARVSLNATAGINDQVNYSVYGSRDITSEESNNNYGGDVQYRTPYSQVGTSASFGDGFSQYSFNSTGSILAHSGGLVFSPEQGETVALVEANGAEGAEIKGSLGTTVNASGYAAVSNLTPYRVNTVGLDPKGLSRDVELALTSQQTVPRRGAIVKLKYPTVTGKPLLLSVDHTPPIPFGSQVVNSSGEQISLVGQGGLIFIRGEHSVLRIVWGQSNSQSCTLKYTVPPDTGSENYVQVKAQCLSAEK